MMIPLLKLRPRPNTTEATVDGIASYIPTSNILIPLLSSSSSSRKKKKETATAVPTTKTTGTGAAITAAESQSQRANKTRVGDPAIRSRSSLPMMSMMMTSSRSTPPSQQQQQPKRRMTLSLSQMTKQLYDDNNRHSFVTVTASASRIRLDDTSTDDDNEDCCDRNRDRIHCDGGRKRSQTMMMMIDPQQKQNNEEEQRDKKKKKLFDNAVLSPSIAPVLFTPPPQPPLAVALLPMKTPSRTVSTPVCTGEADRGDNKSLLTKTMLQVVTTSAHVDRKKKEMVKRPSFLKLPSSLLSVSSNSPLPSLPSPSLPSGTQLIRSTMMCTSYDEDDDAIGECDYTHENDDDAVHRLIFTTASTATKSLTTTTATATTKTMPKAPLFLIRKKEGRGGGRGVLHRMKKQTAHSLSLGNHRSSSVFLTPPIVLDETRFLMQEMVS